VLSWDSFQPVILANSDRLEACPALNVLDFPFPTRHSAGMRLSCVVVMLALLGGCAPREPAQRSVEIDPMRPVRLRPAWEQFARQTYSNSVLSLVDPARNIDFADGPENVRCEYLPDVGTLLTATGPVQYDDERGVRMQATYFVRWYFAGVTNTDYTPWTLRAAGVLDKKPVPPPETQAVPNAQPM
jgi:hypothetical protein